jgi:HD-GYP domain-containing protein (c-di-GMP phosphodiesterase class II)
MTPNESPAILSPVTAEVLTPPGREPILSFTFERSSILPPALDLSALHHAVCDSIWPPAPAIPQVYLGYLDPGSKLITRAFTKKDIRLALNWKPQPTSYRRKYRAIQPDTTVSIIDGPWLAELVRSRLERSLTLDATIDGWTHALALRDEDTSTHTQRVTELVTQLSRKIGLSEDLINVLRRGARLHDIGKMGIPDKILLKPGPLDGDDWKLMQKHPLFAYEMLHAIPFVEGALDVPYCHHERWDGTGYPRGLKGEEIPLLARIFSVVDVWDALCSNRPYRPAWARARAIQYLVEQSGRQFDPYMTTAFLDMIHSPDIYDQA